MLFLLTFTFFSIFRAVLSSYNDRINEVTMGLVRTKEQSEETAERDKLRLKAKKKFHKRWRQITGNKLDTVKYFIRLGATAGYGRSYYTDLNTSLDLDASTQSMETSGSSTS